MIYNLKTLRTDKWLAVRKFDQCFTNLGVAVGKHGKPETGLTKQDETELEGLLNLNKGELAKESEFWTSYEIRIGLGELTFDEEVPEEKLQLLTLRAMPEVADGYDEAKSNARAEYLLYSKEQEAVASNKKHQVKKQAYKELEKLGLEDMTELLMSYGISMPFASPDVIETKVFDLMESNPAKFISIIKDPLRDAKKFVRTCLSRGLLEDIEGAIFHNEDVVGVDITSCAIALFNGKYKQLKAVLEAELNTTTEKPKRTVKAKAKSKPKPVATEDIDLDSLPVLEETN